MISIKTKIGAHLIEASAPTIKEAIELNSLLAELPTKCGSCKSDDLAFHHRTAQNYDFYSMVCRGCGCAFPLGQKQLGGGLFPRGPWEHPRYGASQEDSPPPTGVGPYEAPAPSQTPYQQGSAQQAPPTQHGTPGN